MTAIPEQIRQFITDNIDSVAHLEALLVLREGIGRTWAPSAVARRLYVQPEAAAEVLRVLRERGLIVLADPDAPTYKYEPETPERARLLEDVATVYAKQLVAVTQLIHAKAAGDVHASRLRKDE